LENNKDKQDAGIEQIREILLSELVTCWDNSSDFFTRLITITELHKTQKNNPDLNEEYRTLTHQGLEKIKELSPQLKTWILNETTSDNKNELYLIKFLLLNQSNIKILQHYPYLIGYEWKVDLPEVRLLRPHIGDLVFMDEHHRFLVVEVKYIDDESKGDVARKKRNQRRNKVCNQAIKYGNLFKMMFPWAVVLKGAFTNESLDEKLSLKFKKYCRAEEKARKAKGRVFRTYATGHYIRCM
jgi:hypothetical protein